MKPYEFKRFYHPKLGRFVYKHKGNGLIVGNIFKPIRTMASSAFKNVAKPLAKKAIKSGVEHAGNKIGRKAAEKSGDLIMRRQNPAIPTIKEEESTDMILNRLISGQGIRKRN